MGTQAFGQNCVNSFDNCIVSNIMSKPNKIDIKWCDDLGHQILQLIKCSIFFSQLEFFSIILVRFMVLQIVILMVLLL